MAALVLYIKWLIAAELLAAVTVFATWKKWKNNYFIVFPFYLTVISLLELAHFLLFKYHYRNAADIIYTIAPFLEILFISWFFYKTLSPKKRNITIAGAAVYIAAFVVEKTILKENTYYFQSLSYTVGTLFILIYLILFFTELARSKNIFTFKQLTVFWVACGMLVFYLGTFPFYGLYNELAKDLNVFIPVAWVATTLNYCMYLLFTIGFIWGKPH
jgi:hypothetical protein